jgi:hypothetical protein
VSGNVRIFDRWRTQGYCPGLGNRIRYRTTSSKSSEGPQRHGTCTVRRDPCTRTPRTLVIRPGLAHRSHLPALPNHATSGKQNAISLPDFQERSSRQYLLQCNEHHLTMRGNRPHQKVVFGMTTTPHHRMLANLCKSQTVKPSARMSIYSVLLHEPVDRRAASVNICKPHMMCLAVAPSDARVYFCYVDTDCATGSPEEQMQHTMPQYTITSLVLLSGIPPSEV